MGRRRALSVCLEGGCPELVPHGQRRCPEHHHAFEVARGRRSGSRSARDNTSHKRFAREVKKRDGHRCVRCGAAENLRAHHVVPVHKGGSDDPEPTPPSDVPETLTFLQKTRPKEEHR